MLVFGASGLASEILDVLVSNKYNYDEKSIKFFDNVNSNIPDLFFGIYPIIKDLNEIKKIFSYSPNYCIGIGSIKSKIAISQYLNEQGGICQSIISSDANISKFGTQIGIGSIVLGNAQITSSVIIGSNCLIYMNSSITHDCELGNFVHVSPNVCIAGRVKIGSYTFLGAGSIILPDINIGENCIIGAGSVITKNIPSNSCVIGSPGRIVDRS